MKIKMINKVFITTVLIFALITMYTIPIILKQEKNVLRTNMEIKEEEKNENIYYINKNKLLVKVPVNLKGRTKKEKIIEIIELLKKNNKNIDYGLQGYISIETKVIEIDEKDNIIKINLSNIFKDNSIDKNLVITGIVYSILELNNVKGVTILVDSEKVDGYKDVITKDIGINNEYFYKTRNNIEKVVIYYLDDINNNYYYVPVTRYLNDTREKVEVIIDELKSKSTNNLVNLINEKIKLIEYNEEQNVLNLNFNNYLLSEDDNTNDRIMKVIAYTMFENYDINMVTFEVNKEKVGYISKKN